MIDKSKVLVWDVPTRVFHWLLALSFTGAFLTAESERYRDVHVLLGYTVLGLVAFRLLWGLLGTRYARFWSFAYGPKSVLSYVKSLFSRSPQHYRGPQSSRQLGDLRSPRLERSRRCQRLCDIQRHRWPLDGGCARGARKYSSGARVRPYRWRSVKQPSSSRKSGALDAERIQVREVGGRNPLPPSPGRRRTRRGSGRTLDRRSGLAARGMDASGARRGGREIPIGGPKARRLKPLRLR